jgi:hypothetical protein
LVTPTLIEQIIRYIQTKTNLGNVVLFKHASLDGFAAGPNGEMNWIHVDQEIFDYAEERIAKTDTALYGRVFPKHPLTLSHIHPAG